MKRVIEEHPVLFIMTGFFIVILIGLSISFFFGKTEKNLSGDNQAEQPTTQVVPFEQTTEAEKTTEVTSEEAIQEEVTEENFIFVLHSVLCEAGSYDGYPVTQAFIKDYENNYFLPEDIVSVEAIPDMCDFHARTACFNVTTKDGVVDSYGVSFTVVDGKLNYINVYYVPSGAEGGV